MITDNDIEKLKKVFATKDDLASMEKRQDTKYATKDDLKSFATKDDLKSYPTKGDLTKAFEENNKIILKGVAEYLESAIIRILNDHEKRIDRLEKSVGGFPPITS